ncbi:MAG: hypothetical protein ACI87W_002196, partial [Halieaceae bacterium]
GGWQSAGIGDMLPDDVREQMRERVDWDGLLDSSVPIDAGAGTSGEGRR